MSHPPSRHQTPKPPKLGAGGERIQRGTTPFQAAHESRRSSGLLSPRAVTSPTSMAPPLPPRIQSGYWHEGHDPDSMENKRGLGPSSTVSSPGDMAVRSPGEEGIFPFAVDERSSGGSLGTPSEPMSRSSSYIGSPLGSPQRLSASSTSFYTERVPKNTSKSSKSSTTYLTMVSDHFNCSYCDASFIDQARLDIHVADKHDGGHNHSPPLKYQCRLCGWSWGQRKELTYHQLDCKGTKEKRGRKLKEQKNALLSRIRTPSTGPLPPVQTDLNSPGEDSEDFSSPSGSSDRISFDINDTEPEKLQKIMNNARYELQSEVDARGEPTISKSARNSNTKKFAKTVARNVAKAVEAGYIRMETLTEGLNNPIVFPVHETSRAFPQRPDSAAGSARPRRSRNRVAPEGKLACPYAKGDPSRYLACLLIHRKDMVGMREHLGRKHYNGSTPTGAISSRDWPSLFRFCFPQWTGPIPDGRFDYFETIEVLQAQSPALGEPLNTFLRDLQGYLSYRRAKEIQEMEEIYAERSWRRFHEFLSRAYGDENPNSSIAPYEPAPTVTYAPPQDVVHPTPQDITLHVYRDIQFATNQYFDFPFQLGYFQTSHFRQWLESTFSPPPGFTTHHLYIVDFEETIRSYQQLEEFMNIALPSRRPNNRQRHWDGSLTVIIRENNDWISEYIVPNPGPFH